MKKEKIQLSPEHFGNPDGQFAVPDPQRLNPIKIQGVLTSRIEKRGQEHQEPYYYGFFKIPQQAQEIPVVFKDEKGTYKPTIPKGGMAELMGD
jgi:hypothetical protein